MDTGCVPDDVDRRPDLDVSGGFRVALRAALVRAQDGRSTMSPHACGYQPVHAGRCENHGDRHPPVGDGET